MAKIVDEWNSLGDWPSYAYVTLFLKNGATLQFSAVVDYRRTWDNKVTFWYTSKETKARCFAEFHVSELAGVTKASK